MLSTGDELIPPTETPDFGQIRDSNAYTLFGALREAGAIPVLAGIIRDDADSLKQTVLDHLIQADAFISSGGVSVGERDVVKAAFFRRGDIDFYKVAMQPGMPQGFGHIEGKPYFGLPGNPVSVFVSFELFVRPAMLKMMGRTQLDRPEVTATRLAAEVSGPKGKMQYARVVIERGDDGWIATPTGGRGSNLISTVARANGLAMIPPGHRDRAGRVAGTGHGLPRRGRLRASCRRLAGVRPATVRPEPTASRASSRSARSPRRSGSPPPSAGSRRPPRRSGISSPAPRRATRSRPRRSPGSSA